MPLSDLLRRWNTTCAAVSATLPAYVAGEADLDPRTASHVSQCLRCQAEIARYRRMLRTLRALRDEAEEPPPSVLSGILAGVDEPAPARHAGPVLVMVAVAAAAAGATGALVWVGRRHFDLGGVQITARMLPTSRTTTKAITTA